MEFDLIPARQNPDFQVGALGGLVVAPVMLVIDFICYTIGAASLGAALDGAVLILVMIPVSAVWLSRILPRRVAVDGAMLSVSGLTFQGSYPWSDIAEMRVMTFGECERRTATIAKAVKMDVTQRCVRVKLRKMIRASFFQARSGTDIALGMPIPYRHLYLWLRQPDEFIQYCSGRFSSG